MRSTFRFITELQMGTGPISEAYVDKVFQKAWKNREKPELDYSQIGTEKLAYRQRSIFYPFIEKVTCQIFRYRSSFRWRKLSITIEI
jgi:hypothetical protein